MLSFHKSFRTGFAIYYLGIIFLCTSCNNASGDKGVTESTSTAEVNETKVVESDKTSPAEIDAPVIGQIETEQYHLKLHGVIPFELIPKTYQPFKPVAGHKLVVLDISIKNRSNQPIDMGNILVKAVVNSSGSTVNYIRPWVVAAYITDHPDRAHQPAYDALWRDAYPPGEVHRAKLLGIHPPNEVNDFKLTLPVSDQMNAATKVIEFSTNR